MACNNPETLSYSFPNTLQGVSINFCQENEKPVFQHAICQDKFANPFQRFFFKYQQSRNIILKVMSM